MFEQLFGTAELNLIVPDTSVGFPPTSPADEWLGRLKPSSADRKQAFFDEQLPSFLTMRVRGAKPEEPDAPSPELLSFISHIQVALEASYISPVSTLSPDGSRSARLSAPPRPGSAKPGARLHHPSIFPPNTPNPTPASADHDRKYLASEGTLLSALIWGQNTNTTEETQDAFALLWSEQEQVWVAIYRLYLTVSFLRLNIANPLLCLTVSATLRDRPLALASPKHPLAQYLNGVGGMPSLSVPSSPAIPSGNGIPGDDLSGLEEVNLLEGLFSASMSTTPLELPSSRLGAVSRQKLFSLPPTVSASPAASSPSPTSASRAAHPTLRKSFRKTLQTVSGFRVRMRTVFVPYILLPELEGTHMDEPDDERDRREAGNEERTVVLCVEVENSGDSGSGVGFAVEKVDVKVGGEGASVTLIGWGEGGFTKHAEKTTFPLRIESMAQYNLLYAVSFLRSPEEIDGLSIIHNSPSTDLQRAVAINIFGKPYMDSKVVGDVSYPTQTFSSRWNCVLDLSPSRNQYLDTNDTPTAADSTHANVLPEPASPFPIPAPRLASQRSTTPTQPSAVAGSKRHTIPGGDVNATRPIKSSFNTPNRASSPLIGLNINVRDRDPPPLPATAKASYVPPSISYQAPRSPTTYGPPPPLDMTTLGGASSLAPPHTEQSPMTPAYPPHSPRPPTPLSQGPIGTHATTHAIPSVEIRRERGTAGGAAQSPSTPGPAVPSAFGVQGVPSQLRDSGEAIVVSVGLMDAGGGDGDGAGLTRKIFPRDYFTLDIFVFNQSTWTRRFEVSWPDARRGRGQGAGGGGNPGVISLDNRVRVGPLRPSACQSVRMEFLALSPGVHSIDTLTLTDIESGFSMNLRSVMDVVVHDPTA